MENEFAEAIQAWWAPALAFAAGLVSFASPCVLPLVPGYLSFVSGTRDGESGRPMLPMLLFVVGFAVVFSAMGAFSAVFVPLLRHPIGQQVAGGVVIAIALLMLLYAFRLGGTVVLAERRPFLAKIRPGPAGAMPLGMAFAVGWTPCIGPVLAGVLTLSAAQGGGTWGALLLFFYSLGLGVPLVLIGIGVHRLTGALAFVKRNYHWFVGSGGTLLLAVGILLATNQWVPLLSRLGLLRLVQDFVPPL